MTGLRSAGPARALAGVAGDGNIRRSVTPGGLRVVSEAMPGARCAAFGIWVGVGSRDETRGLAGTSHFLEHLLFKGTQRRDALEIATVMDAVGGEMNAFTSKEYTCYYARVLDEDLPLAVDVVCDMVTSSVIAAADVETERSVVLEEISMHDDEPADAVHEAFAAALFGDHPLGRPVIGTVDSVSALTRAAIKGYYRRRYTPSSMVVAAAGNVDHATLVRMVRRAFDGHVVAGAAPSSVRRSSPVPPPVARATRQERSTEQANVIIGTAALHRSDPRRHALAVLSNALGGGMSSRLFQEVRERRGLAYSVYSFATHHADTGTFGVYAGCAPGKVDEVLDVVRRELSLAAEHGLTDEECTRAKGQLRSSLVLGLEDAGSRMSRLGKGELVHGRIQPLAQQVRLIDKVTPREVRALAADLLRQPMATALIGPGDGVRSTA